MKIYSTRHLHWVLCTWLGLVQVALSASSNLSGGGEDGLAKSEKRLVFKSDVGPRGETLLQRSFSSTRVFSSSSSSTTSSSSDEDGLETKPPDDRQSTSRLRNDSTVDLSRNTVPVLRSTLDGVKYRRTTTALPEGVMKKSSGKLKRNNLNGVTRPRPSDLTTLLAFNALNPTRLLHQYPTTTQVAESMPPTAWALASLKIPSSSTRKPGLLLKPFVSWSTRLNKPTTPSPPTELTESATGLGETTLAQDIFSDITAEGVDNTDTPSMPKTSQNNTVLTTLISNKNESSQNDSKQENESSKDDSTESNESTYNDSNESNGPNQNDSKQTNQLTQNEPTQNYSKQTNEPTQNDRKQVNEPTQNDSKQVNEPTQNDSKETNEPTQNDSKQANEPTQNDSKYTNKTTQNDSKLSNEPTQNYSEQTNLSSQNEGMQENTEKPQDITQYKTEENTISVPPLSSLKNTTLDDLIEKKDISTSVQYVSNRDGDYSQETGMESSLKTDSIFPNTDSDKFNATQGKSYFSLASEFTERSSPISSIALSESDLPSSSIISVSYSPNINDTSDIQSSSEVMKDTPFESKQSQSDSILDSTKISADNKTENMKETEQTPEEMKFKVTTKNSEYHDGFNSEVTMRRYDNTINGTVQEADPSFNVINEKKNDELSTSTVVSAVNSTITMHVSPVLTTPGNINITNLVEEGKPDEQFVKHLPLTAETTTTSRPVFSPTPQPELMHIQEKSSQKESDQAIINQTINDIKSINDIKQMPIPLDTNTETSSKRSNEIKHETIKNIPIADELNNTHNHMQDIPETTQSNYIQVHEISKPQNKTILPHFRVTEEEIIKPQNKTILPHFRVAEEVTERPSAPDTTIPITTMRTTISTKVPPLFNMSTTVTMLPTISPENPVTLNDSGSVSLTTVTTPPPITTTPLSTTTNLPVTMVTFLPSSTSTSVPSTSTIKSNEIKDQENLPIPEKNMTKFQYESPNVLKNESTPVIIPETDLDLEDEDGTFNHTDLGEKKTPNDHINNGDGDESNEDGFPDIIGNSSIHMNEKNSSKNIPVNPTELPTTLPTTTKPSTTTPNIDEVMATQLDEEPPNLDEDTVYDTGVIMSVYIQIIFEANYSELCREKDQLRNAIVKIFKKYAERTVDKRQVQLVNLSLRDCAGLRGEMDQRHTPVQLYLTDQQGQYDKTLNDIFLSLARQNQLDFKYPITHIEKVIGQHELIMDTDSSPSGTVVAAIIISSIAAVCLFALTILLVIMRKRQSGFNYGQRCTPVSLDDYSLDNISVYNSVRRKAMRASKRSYGNPAFDDPDVISNPVNFAGLANMASNKPRTDDEFSNLTTVVVKSDELPPGTESKNRYANVIPLPETRVQLHSNTSEGQYINANYVKGAKEADKCYIACQAPMQNTIEDFWKMVWDDQCRLIIMLTALSENGVEKCADYLPPSEVLDCHRVFGDLQVTLKKREAREKYVIASLQLKNIETNLWREVTHMWYAGWPPTGVPPEPSSMIAFLIEARSYAKGAPTVVHCSPGTGRTGTVIAIDIAIRDFEAGRSVDIPKTVIQVRRGRAGAVQTKDQYHFIYKVLHLYATKLTGGGLDSI